MKKPKNLFGSMYMRFLIAFLGAFLLSMLIPVLSMNFIQAPRIVENVNQTVEGKAKNIKQLVEKHGFTLPDAINLLSTKDTRIEEYTDINQIKVALTKQKIEAAEHGEIISHWSETPGGAVYAIFKCQDTWVYIAPDKHNGQIPLFFSAQMYSIIMPICIGIVLIFLATITVVRPIKKISYASKKIAKGDFTAKVKSSGSGELRELTDNFNKMIDALNENEYLHKEFVSNVSHEFNTPITSIKGYAKLLKRKAISEEKRQEYADIIIYEGDRLSSLSSDLLRLSELENAGTFKKGVFYSLDEQIRDVVLLMQNQWEEKNIDMDLDLDEIKYNGDKALMHQVWMNLISNAIKYTGQDGKIKIILEQENGIVVKIIDNGIGISKDDMDKIFLRFYKGDKSRNSSGTGLGLSIVKKIIELHGGDVQVEPALPHGTKFTVRL